MYCIETTTVLTICWILLQNFLPLKRGPVASPVCQYDNLNFRIQTIWYDIGCFTCCGHLHAILKVSSHSVRCILCIEDIRSILTGLSVVAVAYSNCLATKLFNVVNQPLWILNFLPASVCYEIFVASRVKCTVAVGLYSLRIFYLLDTSQLEAYWKTNMNTSSTSRNIYGQLWVSEWVSK